MRTKEQMAQLRAQAVALRLAGKSRREIKEILGSMSNSTLDAALRGVPPADWTKRPNAKDELRSAARDLRTLGMDLEEIAAQLGVAKSSASLWVRDMPIPARLSYEERRSRAAAGVDRYWEAERPVREARRAAERDAAALEISDLTEREILIAGSVAYWCEGAKNKPYSRRDRVVFINSDPALIGFFLRFLDAAGVSRGDLVYRLQIHESADVEAAQRFWMEFTGASPDQFRRPTLKTHNPRTVRKNVGDQYRGCLRIDVRRSGGVYRKIEGWMSAITTSSALSGSQHQPVS
jgi:transposase